MNEKHELEKAQLEVKTFKSPKPKKKKKDPMIPQWLLENYKSEVGVMVEKYNEKLSGVERTLTTKESEN
jgi:hypothetical protein